MKFEDAYKRYAGSNKDTRGALWDLCVTTYLENIHGKTFIQLSEIIGKSDDTVRDWSAVGYLVFYCEDQGIEVDVGTEYDLRCLWDNFDTLEYDHLLRVARLAKRHELDPQEILERLYNSVNGQTAGSLERDIEETHEEPEILLRRDMARIVKRLEQNINSLEFRGASPRVIRAGELFLARIKQELA